MGISEEELRRQHMRECEDVLLAAESFEAFVSRSSANGTLVGILPGQMPNVEIMYKALSDAIRAEAKTRGSLVHRYGEFRANQPR